MEHQPEKEFIRVTGFIQIKKMVENQSFQLAKWPSSVVE